MKIALAAAALLASPQVCAFQAHTGESVTVSYADLNLNTARDRARLEGRVDAAIDEACGVTTNRTTFAARHEAERCVDETTPVAQAALARVLGDRA